MNALEILLGRRWILKSRDRELYYRMKDEAPAIKKFLTEKLGYQMIVNPYLIKIEKMPAKPENWMGILEFNDKIEYVFFCMILMFLEEKEAMEQFVLSELTEYIQGQYQEEQIDWTVYQYRRHLIKETFKDKEDRDEELHTNDTVQEKLSLVARFGVTIFFGKPDKKQFQEIVRQLASRTELEITEEELMLEANKWELSHGGMSGRAAQQFVDYLLGTRL